MVVIIALVALSLLFFVIRKHTGPADLAMIAGVVVFEKCGTQIADWLHGAFGSVPTELFQHVIYLFFVLVIPIALYLHSAKGGLSGLLRVVEALSFAVVTVSLISTQLAYFFPFDELSMQIANFIKTIEGPIVIYGTVTSYLDIMFYR